MPSLGKYDLLVCASRILGTWRRLSLQGILKRRYVLLCTRDLKDLFCIEIHSWLGDRMYLQQGTPSEQLRQNVHMQVKRSISRELEVASYPGVPLSLHKCVREGVNETLDTHPEHMTLVRKGVLK